MQKAVKCCKNNSIFGLFILEFQVLRPKLPLTLSYFFDTEELVGQTDHFKMK